jgi:peptidoglycan/LPS O-acetylase OafA/YrhL
MNSVLLIAIGILSPWTVHLAPPKQRPLALLGVIVVFVLYGIFAENPLTTWEMWAGLAAGVVSVLIVAGGGVGGIGPRGGRSRPPRRRSGRSPADDDPGATGETL